MIKARRKVRVNTSLSSRQNRKLRLLAFSCNKPRATMAQICIDYCLENGEILNKLQERYNTTPEYWVRRVTGHNGDYENTIYAVGYPQPEEKKEPSPELVRLS